MPISDWYKVDSQTLVIANIDVTVWRDFRLGNTFQVEFGMNLLYNEYTFLSPTELMCPNFLENFIFCLLFPLPLDKEEIKDAAGFA